MKTLRRFGALTIPFLLGLGLAACAQSPVPATTENPPAAMSSGPPAQLFDSPADAVKALRAATEAKDHAAIRDMFGPAIDQLLSGDDTQDAVEFGNFSAAVDKMCNPVARGDDQVVLYIGEKNWPFPIPLVRANGRWFFDTAAGREEILNRRIGEDELAAISVCRNYLLAQHEYASIDRNDDGILSYAQRLNSTPGNHDGLYWPPVEGEQLSPFGPLVANAHEEGYDADLPVGRTAPFHGYLFKILKEQGPAAVGGKYNYVINGNMVAGFALVAYPAHWGESGIMTFIVNQNGKIFQRNLGGKSTETAAAITVFNPDESWTALDSDAPASPAN
jgi:hypothetical protein